MKLKLLILSLSIVFLACQKSTESHQPVKRSGFPHEPLEAQKPFPQSCNFKACIKPDHITQTELNNDVESYFTYWKSKYIRESNGVTPGGGNYVQMKGTGGDGNEITTSEAHGYGMIIFALMAGQIPDAQKYFDGMLNMFNQHRSTINPYCMSWVIHKTEDRQYDKGSATDGDMDVAYALLLAHKQWGSEGVIDYLSLSRDIINKGLKESCVSSVSKRTMLGDWDSNDYTTRSSDWMTAHFRSFHNITNDNLWIDAADEVYRLINYLTTNYSSQTGLMPDFIVGNPAQPAPEYYLNEYKETDEYSWNACRYPWRITADYAHFGTVKARQAMEKLLDFMISENGNDPSKIMAGYYLNGKPMVNYSSAAFTAPIVVASITDERYQAFLNNGWDYIKATRESYYGDTICLLNMLLISGNWWNPLE